VYLHPAYAEFHRACEPEYVFPDVYLHTDKWPPSVAHFMNDEVLDKNGRVEISIITKQPLAKLEVPIDRYKTFGTGEVLYFELNVKLELARLHHTQELGGWELDTDSDRFHTRYKVHLIYARVDNSVLLERMLRFDARLSHAVDRCPGGWGGGGSGGGVAERYRHLPHLRGFLRWAGCRELITDRDPLPMYGRTIRTKSVISSNTNRSILSWIMLSPWSRGDFLTAISREDTLQDALAEWSDLLYWDLRDLTDSEMQRLVSLCRKKANFKSTLIRLIQANMHHDDFLRVFRFLDSGERSGIAGGLIEETPHLLSEILISVATFFSMEGMQGILDEHEDRVKGRLDIRRLKRNPGAAQMFGRLLKDPRNLKFFDNTSVPDIVFEQITGWRQNFAVEQIRQMLADGMDGGSRSAVEVFGHLLNDPRNIKYFDERPVSDIVVEQIAALRNDLSSEQVREMLADGAEEFYGVLDYCKLTDDPAAERLYTKLFLENPHNVRFFTPDCKIFFGPRRDINRMALADIGQGFRFVIDESCKGNEYYRPFR